MTHLAYITEPKALDKNVAHVWKCKPTMNSFLQDTVLDPTAFLKLPILMIKSGVIGVQHTLGDGRQTNSVLYYPGEVLDCRHFGKLFGRLICLMPVIVEMYNGEDYDQMQRKDFHYQDEQAKIKAAQLVFASQHSVDLARKSAAEKLASFILESRKRQNLGRTLCIGLMLRRVDIADYMGLRAETLSRAFSKLKKMKLISYNNPDVMQIINEPGLRQMANGKTIKMKTGEL